MAQKSGFFNAMLNAGVYDRQYNANDYSDNLAVIISNGVLRSTNNDLHVTASGLNLTVGVGRAWINGHYYLNSSAYSLPTIVPPTGGSRIDRVVLRFDNSISVRSITIQYLQGTASTSPVAPSLTRTDTIFELCLADIYVNANASSVATVDKRGDKSVCGWVYSVSGDNSFFEEMDDEFDDWFDEKKDTLASVTLFKQYKWEDTLETATNVVQFDVPQYDAETCFFDVYLNGILADDYTANGNILTFTTTLVAETEITVLVYKSIDGTGIMSVADEITELQNQYATLNGVSKYVYYATGLDDNISLSQIAEAFYEGAFLGGAVTTAAKNFLNALGGNTYLGSLPSDAKITIEVVGKLGVTTPAYGSGTSGNRYRYFNLGQTSVSNRQIEFDFNKAEKIYVECEGGTHNIIFYGSDLNIKNVYCKATGGTQCAVQMIAKSNSGRVNVENCYFEIICSGTATIANHGTFINCYCYCASSGSHALCFVPDTNSLIRLIGGTYRAYISASGMTAAVMYTYANSTNAVLLADNINCPTISVAGYSQQYLSVAYAGKTIINLVTSTMDSTGNYNSITNQVWKSKNW